MIRDQKRAIIQARKESNDIKTYAKKLRQQVKFAQSIAPSLNASLLASQRVSADNSLAQSPVSVMGRSGSHQGSNKKMDVLAQKVENFIKNSPARSDHHRGGGGLGMAHGSPDSSIGGPDFGETSVSGFGPSPQAPRGLGTALGLPPQMPTGNKTAPSGAAKVRCRILP